MAPSGSLELRVPFSIPEALIVYIYTGMHSEEKKSRKTTKEQKLPYQVSILPDQHSSEVLMYGTAFSTLFSGIDL
ncbi:hypothetical protein TNCV_3153011 [Trichonephila clavipes]|nr:hypothetical protein TNCV_3153011 [Trichonephila clavipes]